MKYFITALILFFITLSIANAQVTDSLKQKQQTVQGDTLSKQSDSATDYADNDLEPLLFIGMFGMLMFGLMAAGAIIGSILLIGGTLLFFGLISAGIISASVAIALYKKSFTKGFKTFVLTCAMAAGMFIGGTTFWILNSIYHWFSTSTAITSGLVAGLLSGLVFGYIALFILKRLVSYFKNKLKFA